MDGSFPTSQFQNVIAFFLGEMILVLDHKVPSYRLWAGPRGVAERTLPSDLMLVSYMSFEFLESSRILCFLTPLKSCDLSRLNSVVWAFLEGRHRLWALPLIPTPVMIFAAMGHRMR